MTDPSSRSSTSSNIAFTGSCACGNVKYTCTYLPQHLTNCYCITCRKLSGAPFITFANVPTTSLTFTSGPSSYRETSYSDLATRRHCAECGSPISMQYKCEPDHLGLAVGSIDEESVRGVIPPVEKHIFVDSVLRIGGFEVPGDSKPRWGKFSRGFQKTVDVWKQSVSGPGLG